MSSTTPGEQPTQNARNEVDNTGIISTTEQPTNIIWDLFTHHPPQILSGTQTNFLKVFPIQFLRM